MTAAARFRAPVLFQGLRGAGFGGLGADLAAGLTLAAIAIPEQMATARLGGFEPQSGLFAFVAATAAFAIFGAGRAVSSGADSTITPIFAGSLALLAAAGSPQYLVLAAALALLVGVLVMLAGLFRLGWIADLLSQPVTTGFLAGIAVHIAISQAPVLLGLPSGAGDTFARLAALWRNLGHASLAAALIGLGVFAVTLGAEKLSPRAPGALLAVAAATLATITLGLDHHGLPVLGRLSGAPPAPRWPSVGWNAAGPLAGLATVIALVVMVQTGATARSFGQAGADPDINGDYIGVGAGNLACGVFGLFPVDASPPRTAAVSAAGGRSQFAGLAAALAVLVLATLGTRLLERVPAAALAGVLIYIAQRIFRVRVFRTILNRTPQEFALAALTTAAIVLLPIQTGVALGMAASFANGVFTITRARLIPFERVEGTTVWWPAEAKRAGVTTPGVLVMGFQAPLAFLNAHEFRRAALDAIDAAEDLKLFVLEASSIVEIDYTAAELLCDVIRRAHDRGVDFAIARLESVRAQAAASRYGVDELLGPNHIFHSVAEAIDALGPRA